MEYQLTTHSHEETMAIGEYIAAFLTKEDVILLNGELGAGKTCFTKGIGKGLGVNETVTSPTFNIVRCYFNNKLNLYHIDAYRLEGNRADIGLEEYLYGDGVCLIEWSQYIDYLLPKTYLEINIEIVDLNTRIMHFVSNSAHYDEIVEKVIKYGK